MAWGQLEELRWAGVKLQGEGGAGKGAPRALSLFPPLQAHAAVTRTGAGEARTSGVYPHGRNGALVVLQHPEHRAGLLCGVPHADGAVVGGSEEHIGLDAERQAGDGLCVAPGPQRKAAVLGPPYADFGVHSRRRQQSTACCAIGGGMADRDAWDPPLPPMRLLCYGSA